ncbi:MAG: hypothetical protein ABFR36_00580 [Acidobacteriota bacterium]
MNRNTLPEKMKLAIIVLNRIELLEDLLSAFFEIDIPDANVIDSVGMKHIISHDIPIFAGLMDSFTGSSPKSKTIFVRIEDEMTQKLIEVVRDICSDPDESDTGYILFLPIEKSVDF